MFTLTKNQILMIETLGNYISSKTEISCFVQASKENLIIVINHFDEAIKIRNALINNGKRLCLVNPDNTTPKLNIYYEVLLKQDGFFAEDWS